MKSRHRTPKRRWLRNTLALAMTGALLVACGDAGESAQSDDVTDIDNSSVKHQSIGNCWIYASVGWVESLRLTHAGEELNLSESYLTYWHWFEQLHGGGAGENRLSQLRNNELSTGGFWRLAVELMRRYGLVNEGDFIPEEAEDIKSARQKLAFNAINASLASGELSDPANRADAQIVRAELDKAWELSPEVSALLNEVFGPDVSRTLYDNPPIPEGSGMRTVHDLEVGHDGNGTNLTLADAIGEPVYSYVGVSKRSGPFAWNSEDYPYPYYTTDQRDFLARVQDVMHRRLPAIMRWYVDFNALENDNTFRTVPESPGRSGGHMTVVEDYQVTNVPGYGTLEAGVLVTDPDALEAALAPEAQIEFFRIKNSWGPHLSPDPGQGDELKGYYDLWMSYLNADIPQKEGGTTRGMRAVILPPDTFHSGGGAPEEPEDPTGECAHDLCETGSALDPGCDSCAAQVGQLDPFCINNSWDDVCVGEVTEFCGIACGS